MKEKLFSFLPDQFPDPEAFFVELTGVTYPDPHYRIDRDRSPVLCLEYVISGKGHVEVGGRSFDPQEGDVYLLPMGLHHRYRSDPHDPWKKIWMNLRGTLCADLLRNYRLGETYHIPDCPLQTLFQEFVSVCAAPPADPWELERQCALLFHQILSRIRSSLSILPEQPSGPVEQARELLDRSLYSPVSVEKVARLRGPFPLPAYPGVFHPFWGNTLPLSAFPPVGNSLSAPTRDSFTGAGDCVSTVLFRRTLLFHPIPPQNRGYPFRLPAKPRETVTCCWSSWGT